MVKVGILFFTAALISGLALNFLMIYKMGIYERNFSLEENIVLGSMGFGISSIVGTLIFTVVNWRLQNRKGHMSTLPSKIAIFMGCLHSSLIVVSYLSGEESITWVVMILFPILASFTLNNMSPNAH